MGLKRGMIMGRPNRRQFLKIMGATGAALLAGRGAANASETHQVNNETIGMLYDATKCVGCKACMSACKRVNSDYGSLSYEQAKFDNKVLKSIARVVLVDRNI